jgi:hypothetical protein
MSQHLEILDVARQGQAKKGGVGVNAVAWGCGSVIREQRLLIVRSAAVGME